MNHQALRLTPSNSPFFKNTPPRSPTKPRNDEAGLRLKRIVGTTTANKHGFDCLPAARQFAYCAGAAAVVATVHADLSVTQRFFRARPTSSAGGRDGPGSFPISPTPNEARGRALGHVREHTVGGSPLGTSARDWFDSPSGKTATAKDRVKAATSVALSPNAKWVAVGETGYKPRVLIFSNAGDSSEAPVYAISEHTFGVHALSFSPDSRFLASLGTVNDGFLYLWSIDDRTGAASLHSSNKCTVLINHMLWVGRSLLTVGLRFVKVWRSNEEGGIESRTFDSPASVGMSRQRNADFGNSILSPKQRVLAGKNSLLGDLLDCNFVCAVPVDDEKAIICAESGEIALLDDISKSQSLRPVTSTPYQITAARADESGMLHVTGASGMAQRYDLVELQQRPPLTAKRDQRHNISPSKSAFTQPPVTIATATIEDLVIELDSRRNIRLARFAEHSSGSEEMASNQLPAHNDAVLGAKPLISKAFPEAAFLTFSGNGVVQLWDGEGTSASRGLRIPVESSSEMYDQTNELRAIASVATRDGEYIAAGDRYGTLTVLDVQSGAVTAQARAHSSEIADVVAFQRSGVSLVATCSRDRTVQLFTWERQQLDLLQTMEEHAAAVSGLLVIGDGETLLSYSQDRTVVVRQAMVRQDDDPLSLAFVMTRAITLKSSPTSICPAADRDNILIAAMGRCIGQYNIKTGQAGFSFKCSDGEGGEAVSMSKIAYEPSLNGNPAIIGISSGDKSVRLYSEYGSLIARDWGHTEGVTDVTVIHSKQDMADGGLETIQVVTVAADSTIFVWDTAHSAPTADGAVADATRTVAMPTNALTTPLRPPLRKVLSFSELSRFKREKSIEEGTDSPVPSSRHHSPQHLRKKPSKISIAQAPRLEPASRTGHAENSRRRSLRKRSPSPPSPRTRKNATASRKPSLGMTLRSKSSENVLSGVITSPTSSNTGFGSLTASTESVCRTLRTYRKKLSNSSTVENMPANALQELEAELRLTAEAIEDKLPSKRNEDVTVSKALKDASEKIVKRIDNQEQVEDGLRKSTDATPATAPNLSTTLETDERGEDVDAVAGALEKAALDE